MLSELLKAIPTVIAAFFGAWFAAHFALRRFFREKAWERKTIAYTAIFDALHDMRRWFDEHMDAEERGKELPDTVTKPLGEQYRQAIANLERRLDTEIWLIPLNCRELLKKLILDLDARREDWIDMLETGQVLMSEAISELRDMVRRDLALESWHSALWIRGKPIFERLKKGGNS